MLTMSSRCSSFWDSDQASGWSIQQFSGIKKMFLVNGAAYIIWEKLKMVKKLVIGILFCG